MTSPAYSGTADFDLVVEAVGKALVAVGYHCEPASSQGDAACLDARWAGSAWDAWLKALPERLLFSVERQEGRVTLSPLFLPSRARLSLLAASWLLMAALLLLAVIRFELAASAERATVLPLVLTSFALGSLLSGGLVYAFGAFGGGRAMALLWQAVWRELEQEESWRLEPGASAASPRWSRALVLHLVGYFALMIWPVVLGWAELLADLPWRLLAFFGLELAFLVLTLTAAFAMARSRAILLRTEALLTGLVSSVAMLLFLSLPLPLLAGASGGVPQLWGRAVLIFSAIVLSLALGLGAYGLASARHTWQTLDRLRGSRRPGMYRDAVVGSLDVRRFRRLFGLWWALLALLLMANGAGVGGATLAAISPQWLPSRLLNETEVAWATALGFSSPWPVAAWVRAGWLVYGGLTTLALVVSVGQLVWDHHRNKRQLLAALRGPRLPGHAEWQAAIDELSQRAGLEKVALLLSDRDEVGPQAHCLGWWSERRVVELPVSCLRLFGPAEVRALLSHELAHHALGHLRMLAWLRLLGRLTFVGDGFALLLWSTADNELAADREAASGRFGVAKVELRGALLSWDRERSRRLLIGSGQPAQPALREPRPATTSLSLWRSFCLQYFHAFETHYWHPTPAERRRALMDGAGKVRDEPPAI